MADFAFCLGRDCKSVALKYNVFMKYGASNFLLGFQLLLSGLSTPCFARLATSRRALCFKASSLFADNQEAQRYLVAGESQPDSCTSAAIARLNQFINSYKINLSAHENTLFAIFSALAFQK